MPWLGLLVSTKIYPTMFSYNPTFKCPFYYLKPIIKIMSTPNRVKLLSKYAIKTVVIAYSFFAHNIVFFKRISSQVFGNISIKHDSMLKHTSMFSTKCKFHTTNLFDGLKQVTQSLSQAANEVT